MAPPFLYFDSSLYYLHIIYLKQTVEYYYETIYYH